MIKSKFTSRKLWACIVGVIIGIATTFGLDEGRISTVSGSVISLGSIVAYVLAESHVDGKRTENQETPIEKEQITEAFSSMSVLLDEIKKSVAEDGKKDGD